jgi:DNA-binding MarR family transcriptional regulator
VKKMLSPKDGRVYMLKLTPKGNALFTKLNDVSDRSVATLVEKLSEHELQELVTMLEGVRRILSK